MIFQDKILLDSNKSRRVKDTANGYLTIFGNPIAVSGVYPYKRYEVDDNTTDSNAYDVVNVYRPLDNLMEIKDSFARKPIIREHEWVGATGTKTNVDGAIGSDVWNVNNALVSDIIIYNPEVIKDIEDGVCTELSPGYKAEVKQETGDYQGVTYEYVMNIKSVNHLAIVDKGRAGKELRLLDEGVKTMNGDQNGQVSNNQESNNKLDTVSTNASIVDSKSLEKGEIKEAKKEEFQSKEVEIMDTNEFKKQVQEMFIDLKNQFNNWKEDFKNEMKSITEVRNQIETDTGIRLSDSVNNLNDLYTSAYEELTGYKLTEGHDAKTAYEVAISIHNKSNFVTVNDSESNNKSESLILDNDILNRIQEIKISNNYKYAAKSK